MSREGSAAKGDMLQPVVEVTESGDASLLSSDELEDSDPRREGLDGLIAGPSESNEEVRPASVWESESTSSSLKIDLRGRRRIVVVSSGRFLGVFVGLSCLARFDVIFIFKTEDIAPGTAARAAAPSGSIAINAHLLDDARDLKSIFWPWKTLPFHLVEILHTAGGITPGLFLAGVVQVFISGTPIVTSRTNHAPCRTRRRFCLAKFVKLDMGVLEREWQRFATSGRNAKLFMGTALQILAVPSCTSTVWSQSNLTEITGRRVCEICILHCPNRPYLRVRVDFPGRP